MKTSKRNRTGTKQRIVEALEEVIAEHGLSGASISLVALKADVSKVLIYRYFGGMDGLLDYYVRTGSIFPHFTPTDLDQLRPLQALDVSKVWTVQTVHLFRQLRSSKAGREVLKAGMIEGDQMADLISQAQEAELSRFVRELSFFEGIPGADSKATSALLLGGLSYLTIMAHNDRPVLGIDLRSELGWQRVEEAVKFIFELLGKSLAHSQSVPVATGSDLAVHEW